MKPYIGKDGRFHDGTGDLDARHHRKCIFQNILGLAFIILTVLFPTQVACLVTSVSLVAIYIMIGLFMLGLWSPRW